MPIRPLLSVASLVAVALLAAAPVGGAAGASLAWGADLPAWWASSDPDRQAAIGASTGAGMAWISVDAKTDGADATPGVLLVVRDAHAQGLHVSARFDVFEDSVAAGLYPASAIAGGPWVDPACADVRAYEVAQVRQLAARGIDEIDFDHERYPETAEAPASAALPCSGGHLGDADMTARITTIATWVRDAASAARAAAAGVRVASTIYPQALDAAGYVAIGQQASALAPNVDVLRPIIYPTYLGAESQPYATVHDWTAKGVAAYGGAKVQPWIQAFGAYSARSDIVGQELKAVGDAGGSGALAWWFWSAGTSASFWAQVASAIGSLPAFTATFQPVNPTLHWVEVRVDANAPVVKVVVRINNNAPVSLAQNPNGTWSMAIDLHARDRVRFVATSTTGATATSSLFRWPQA
ncbi:MAG: hypothetical protein QOE90_2957 [Thermoplasmata archaeon]|jgi:hypothetical protein|nr:hypothetical protein [Thermoplasmata archaeon]